MNLLTKTKCSLFYLGAQLKKFRSKIIKYFDNHEKLCLFFLFLIVYTVNFRLISSGDSIPASLIPFSILENHNLYLDSFSAIYIEWFNSTPYFFAEAKGHYLSYFPVATPVLVTPLYALPYALLKLSNYPISIFNPSFMLIVSIMEKTSASIIASLSAVFVFLSLKELLNKRIAFVGTIIFALATNTWTISSQTLWQHGMTELLLSIMIYVVIINEKNAKTKNIAYLGILSGLLIANRPPDSLLLLPFLVYIYHANRSKIFHYFICVFIAVFPFWSYNFYYFGHIFGGYDNEYNLMSLNLKMAINFIGLLISPNRGLLIYSPILILSIFGYLKIPKITNQRIKIFLFTSGISIILTILVYSSHPRWFGGWSYGYRYLTGMLPMLMIFIGLYLDNFVDFKKLDLKKVISIVLIIILLIWSFFVQIVGAFYYNGGWDAEPNIDYHRERLWDWKDTQILRSFNAGMAEAHNPIEDLYYIWESRKYNPIAIV